MPKRDVCDLLLKMSKTETSLLDVFKVTVFLSATMPFDMEAGTLQLTYDGHVDNLEATYQNPSHTEMDDGVNWLEVCRSTGVIQELHRRTLFLLFTSNARGQGGF